jgi:hypothetical protein
MGLSAVKEKCVALFFYDVKPYPVDRRGSFEGALETPNSYSKSRNGMPLRMPKT